MTIVAALAIGLTTSAAVEFSFLLGLATLSAATALDLVKHGSELTDQFGIATPTPRLARYSPTDVCSPQQRLSPISHAPP